MNCEQGDTAYFKGCGEKGCVGCAPLIGKIGTCVSINGFVSAIIGEPAWNFDPPLVHPQAGALVAVDDEMLRPIRGREGQDETLTWREVPKAVANKQQTTKHST